VITGSHYQIQATAQITLIKFMLCSVRWPKYDDFVMESILTVNIPKKKFLSRSVRKRVSFVVRQRQGAAWVHFRMALRALRRARMPIAAQLTGCVWRL
jgi:hypothetical protein